jgi:hypothetical protein
VPLYATDWTTDVDGDSRTKVAQVVQAHQDELSACFAGQEGARVEVSFAWEGGRPVRIEVSEDSAHPECVRREMAIWRAAVAEPGPYTWELALAVPGPIRVERAWTIYTQQPRKGSVSGLTADGYHLLVSYEVFDHAEADAFEKALTERLPRFAACPASTLTDAIDATWTAVDGQLTAGRATTFTSRAHVAQCLVDAGEGLPYGGDQAVTLRFWRPLEAEDVSPGEGK